MLSTKRCACLTFFPLPSLSGESSFTRSNRSAGSADCVGSDLGSRRAELSDAASGGADHHVAHFGAWGVPSLEFKEVSSVPGMHPEQRIQCVYSGPN